MDIKKKWQITESMPINFTVAITPNIFDLDNLSLLEHGDTFTGSRRLMIIDNEVLYHNSKRIKKYFDHHNITLKIIPIDISEEKKNLDNLMFILDSMENFGILRRSEPLICVGGGVLLDMAAFAASIYRRGIPYIKVPTTLLGIVDASVGVKTSINHFRRRNRLGSYYPPLAAYLDKHFLRTLEQCEIISAMGEILKMAVIKNFKLFCLLEDHIDELVSTKFLTEKNIADGVISIAIDDMISELAPNLWEKNLKRSVDFGHSFSPILEMKSLNDNKVKSLTHGQAVALDVIFSSCLSVHRNYLTLDCARRIFVLAKKMKLDISHPYFHDYVLLWEGLNDTTKHRNGRQNLPIPSKIGENLFLNDVKIDDIKNTIKIYKTLIEEFKV